MVRAMKDRIKKLFAGFTLLSLEVVILIIIFGGALVTFISIAEGIFKDNRRSFDLQAFYFLAGFVSAVNTNVMEFFTFLGTHTFLIPANILLVAYTLFIKKHRWYSIKIPVIA